MTIFACSCQHTLDKYLGASFSCYYEVSKSKEIEMFHVVEFKTPICLPIKKNMVRNIKGEIVKIREPIPSAIISSLDQLKDGSSSLFIYHVCDEILFLNLILLFQNKTHSLMSNIKVYSENCINISRNGIVNLFAESFNQEKSFIIALKKFNKLMYAFLFAFLYINVKNKKITDIVRINKCQNQICKLKNSRQRFTNLRFNHHSIFCCLDKNEKTKLVNLSNFIYTEKTKKFFHNLVYAKF